MASLVVGCSWCTRPGPRPEALEDAPVMLRGHTWPTRGALPKVTTLRATWVSRKEVTYHDYAHHLG